MGNKEEELLSEMIEFDDAFSKGIYAVPSPKCLPRYNIRGIAEYMEKIGRKSSLSEDELERFRIEPKGFICRAVQKVEDATHWLAEFDNDIGECEVTPYQLYRLFLDKYGEECIILDDEKNFSLIYLWHNGRFVVLEETR